MKDWIDTALSIIMLGCLAVALLLALVALFLANDLSKRAVSAPPLTPAAEPLFNLEWLNQCIEGIDFAPPLEIGRHNIVIGQYADTRLKDQECVILLGDHTKAPPDKSYFLNLANSFCFDFKAQRRVLCPGQTSFPSK